jgi:hypothetical protein
MGAPSFLIKNTTSSAALHSEESGAFRRWVSTSRHTPGFWTTSEALSHARLSVLIRRITLQIALDECYALKATAEPRSLARQGDHPASDEKQVSTMPPPPLAGVSEIACLCSTFSCSRMMITLSGGHFIRQSSRRKAWAFSAQRTKIFPPRTQGYRGIH